MATIFRGLLDVVAWIFRQLWRLVAALARWTVASLDDLRQTSGTTQAWVVAFFALAMVGGVVMGQAARPAATSGAVTAVSPQPVVIVVTSTPHASPTPSATRAPTSTPKPTATSGPSPTPSPTNTPGPTHTPRPTSKPSATTSPVSALKVSLMNTLGSCNRPDVQRLGEVSLRDDGQLLVHFAINDNLVESWLVDAALQDCADILKAAAHSSVPYEAVRVEGTFSMKDQYGNVSESIVINATWLKDTITKINWTGFRSENVLHIADWKVVHPSFDK